MTMFVIRNPARVFRHHELKERLIRFANKIVKLEDFYKSRDAIHIKERHLRLRLFQKYGDKIYICLMVADFIDSMCLFMFTCFV